MELRYSFNPERFYLGTLCKHQHRWPGTDLSLRRLYKSPKGATVNHCVACSGRKQSNWLISFIDHEALGLPPGRRLGKLCSRGHRWEGREMSLRHCGHCVECEALRKRPGKYNPEKACDYYLRRKEDPQYLETRREQMRRVSASPEQRRKRLEYKRRLREELRAQGLTILGTVPRTQCGAVSRQESIARAAAKKPETEERRRQREEKKRIRESDPNWAEKERERKRLCQLIRYEIDHEYRLEVRQRARLRKARERGNGGIHVKGKSIRQRFEQFGHQCAYCGATGDLQIEHLIPISKGGTHVLGNILPACLRCNYSKHANDAETWYRAQPWFSERRWQKIKRVLGLRKGSAAQLALI